MQSFCPQPCLKPGFMPPDLFPRAPQETSLFPLLYFQTMTGNIQYRHAVLRQQGKTLPTLFSLPLSQGIDRRYCLVVSCLFFFFLKFLLIEFPFFQVYRTHRLRRQCFLLLRIVSFRELSPFSAKFFHAESPVHGRSLHGNISHKNDRTGPFFLKTETNFCQLPVHIFP